MSLVSSASVTSGSVRTVLSSVPERVVDAGVGVVVVEDDAVVVVVDAVVVEDELGSSTSSQDSRAFLGILSSTETRNNLHCVEK